MHSPARTPNTTAGAVGDVTEPQWTPLVPSREQRKDATMTRGKILAPLVLGAIWLATSNSAQGRLRRMFRSGGRNATMGRRVLRALHLHA
jgi:hypothetical protein